MKTIRLLIIFAVCILFLASNGNARLVLNEEELKQKIVDNSVSTIYLADGGLGGIEKNRFGLVTDDFIVVGPYEKIPDDMLDLARKHNVTITESQRFNDRQKPTSLAMQLFGIGFYFLSYCVLLIVLIIINKKLSTIISILNRRT